MANPEDTAKGQHFLLLPVCRTLTVLDLAKMRDTTACNWFERLRWPETEGEPYCPKCGTLRCYTMSLIGGGLAPVQPPFIYLFWSC